MHLRDSEASAPAEFPPEQPEADLVADGDEYGAEEAEDETGVKAEAQPGDDAEMAGADNENENDNDNDNDNVHEEDEMSEDGSVDIEGESEDELEEEEEEGEGEAEEVPEHDAMEVDDADQKPAASGAKPITVAS